LLSVPADLTSVVKAKDTPELKNVFDFKERTTALQCAFKVNEKAVRGKRILLVDDLYWSGATASIVATALIASGATKVYMLAMTKTRTRT
jgi:predicted amidophosphoribosyltransferase